MHANDVPRLIYLASACRLWRRRLAALSREGLTGRERRRSLMLATALGGALAIGAPLMATAQAAGSDDFTQLPRDEDIVRLPTVIATPSDPFTNPDYYSQVVQHLPCLGACDAPAAARPAPLIKRVLWMLYPAEPTQLTEADHLRMQLKQDTQHADQLP